MPSQLRTTDLICELSHQLGDVEIDRFIDAWRQLHYLTQAVCEVGKSWGEAMPDDSHSSLVEGGIDFVSLALEGVVQGRFDMMAGAEIGVEHLQSNESSWIATEGRTIEELTQWIRQTTTRFLGAPKQPSVLAPDLPEHPLSDGAPIALRALARECFQVRDHYVITLQMLKRFVKQAQGLAVDGEHELVPRIWPHHFDLASLLVLNRDSEGAMTKTIGFGLAVPDSISPSGYWYLAPWVSTDRPAVDFPELPLGRWIEREGSIPMAVLPVATVWDLGKSGEDGVEIQQSAAIAEFAATAFNALLGVFSGIIP